MKITIGDLKRKITPNGWILHQRVRKETHFPLRHNLQAEHSLLWKQFETALPSSYQQGAIQNVRPSPKATPGLELLSGSRRRGMLPPVSPTCGAAGLHDMIRESGYARRELWRRGGVLPQVGLRLPSVHNTETASIFCPTFASRMTPTAGSMTSSLRSRPAPIIVDVRPISSALIPLI